MIELATELLPFSRAAMLTGFIVFLRVGAIMALLPAFGESAVPQRVRLVLALAFTLIIGPAVAPKLETLVANDSFVGIFLATEVVIGLALGMSFRLLVLILQMAGSIAAQATSLSQILGSAGVEPQPAMGHLMVAAGLALAVMSGLHVRVAQAMILSYDVLPVAQFPDGSVLYGWGVGQIARAFGLAFTLAMPFVVVSLIYNLALGIINKAMPQLMVALVGAPAITAGGLFLLWLTLPQMLEIWGEYLAVTLSNPFEVQP